MSLHPIKALDHVISEYRDYLQTEFRAKDANLRAALQQELDAGGFLAQEPFYQAHRPFVEADLCRRARCGLCLRSGIGDIRKPRC